LWSRSFAGSSETGPNQHTSVEENAIGRTISSRFLPVYIRWTSTVGG
jgi:hypothetical protein